MQTTLNLMTRDGLVYMDFRPALNAQQYEELWVLAKQPHTPDDLRKLVAAWAQLNRLKVNFDELNT